MDFPIRFVSRALVDIDEAMSWYELKQVGLGKNFYFSTKAKTDYLKENPEVFPIKRKTIREISVKKFHI